MALTSKTRKKKKRFVLTDFFCLKKIDFIKIKITCSNEKLVYVKIIYALQTTEYFYLMESEICEFQWVQSDYMNVKKEAEI